VTEPGIIGWDIGGVNTKVARVLRGVVLHARSHPYEIQRDPSALAPRLASLAEQIGTTEGDRHAVTMTAELSQMFRTKREGVAFVLDAVTSAFPSRDVHVYTVDGRFLSPESARLEPLAVAASNWAATASAVAASHPDAILIDIGTTTTDIIPIEGGTVLAIGTTDPARLTSGELVYTGALRTPVEAIVQHVPLGDGIAGVSAESFALIGDIHVWRGDLTPDDYSVAAPDGRPPSREFAGERIARVVCADREMLGADAITRIAAAVADSQVDLVRHAIDRVRQRHPSLRTAVVTGLGAFIAARAAGKVGLTVARLSDSFGVDGARSAPAAAVALLLEGSLPGATLPHTTRRSAPNAATRLDVVVKLGGSLLSTPQLLDAALTTVVAAAKHSRVAIVPGGGSFADAVRDADRRLALSSDTSHWMAVLAMDQCAHLLADRCRNLTLAYSPTEVDSAVAAGRAAVVAPYRWLRESDPLPHSWDVTSDSISAWIAATLGAPRLVLVKPPGANLDTAVDPYFAQARSPQVACSIVPADAFVLPVTAHPERPCHSERA
jgi:probable H4MPT-linked C1 transfer pathway protein